MTTKLYCKTTKIILFNFKNHFRRIRRLIQDRTDSSEIDVALNIHRALVINNTSKFFSLIEQQATLLQSCLLNRYFTIVRLKRLSSLIASTRSNTDEFRLVDLTDMLGMDDDEETKDFLEQLGYTVTNANQGTFMIPAAENPIDQQPIKKLSQKLIKSKYEGNLKDIILGHVDTPVVIGDTNVEDSFDLQGSFVGRIPFDLDKTTSFISAPRRPAMEPPVLSQPPRPSINPLFQRRPPSESAPRSVAATTTTNIFFNTTRPMSSTNIFTPATTTTTTTISPQFRFGDVRPSVPPTTSILNPLAPSFQPPRSITPAITRIPTPTPPTPVIRPPPARVPEIIVQPPTPAPPAPPPVSRRLSVNSMDTFIDDIYSELIDPFILETTQSIFDELISQWNKLTKKTVDLFDELLIDELTSIARDYYTDCEFHQKMLQDTINEENARKRKKYLTRKYFALWFEKTYAAKEERSILNELQLKYHFLTNEQLLEFLTGIQLILEHDFTFEQTRDILKSRRLIKRNRLEKLTILSNVFFEEFLNEEFISIVQESNDELVLRQKLNTNALKKQMTLKRERYLRMKYFSLWFSKHQKKRREKFFSKSTTNTNKRLNRFVHLQNSKKFKENTEQYQTLKHSFDQLTTDLNQIQLIINKLSS